MFTLCRPHALDTYSRSWTGGRRRLPTCICIVACTFFLEHGTVSPYTHVICGNQSGEVGASLSFSGVIASRINMTVLGTRVSSILSLHDVDQRDQHQTI
jgi:hypothetical protein